MKRALFLILAIAVAVSLLVIPAFATESYVFHEELGNLFLYSSLPLGKYEVFLWVCDESGVVIRKDSLGVVLHEGNYLYPRSISPDGVEYIYEIFEEYNSPSDFYTCLFISSSEGDYISADYVEFRPYAEPINLLDYIGNRISVAINWVKMTVSELISSEGQLHGLLPLIAVSVAITVVLIVSKIIRRIIWGCQTKN